MPNAAARIAALVLSLLVALPLAAPAGASVGGQGVLIPREAMISQIAITKWSSMLNRAWATQPIAGQACAERVGGDCGLDRWQDFIEKSRGIRAGEQIQRVQAYVNQVAYRDDKDVWGESDYWAAPGEFFARGGDCEDYAIAKYLSLKQLGFDPKDMRVLVLRDTERDLMHAVLLVQFAGNTLVLDNTNQRVLTWEQVPHYRPLYSVNEIDFWMHRDADTA